ncbi:MAG TPA: aminotransferase class IV [Pirellulales bacterium]|jgi:branched-chain amino acid aminotransferase
MAERIVYFNGSYVPESQARVSIYDSALAMGDMAFEVTRTVHGRPFRLDDHLARLFHTLDALRVDPGLSKVELRTITEETLARNVPLESAEVDWNIIHNLSRGPVTANLSAFAPHEIRPTVIVSCFPLVEKLGSLAYAYDEGIDAVVPSQRSIPGDLLDDSLKTRSRLHYQIANLQAEEMRRGAWAVLTDPAGNLTEGTSGNVFIVRHDTLITPRAENLLPGITRQMVFELAVKAKIRVLETDITPLQAADSDEMFMTSTSIGILHVRNFQQKLIGAGGIGPVTARLRAALEDAVGLDFAAQAARYAELRAIRRHA